MRAPVITFLSDYGLQDDFVGVCHGVIAAICPEARVIDITHGIERHDIRGGALILSGALPYMPAGVHLAVVDPDVGARRRAIAVRLADDRVLVGPDNGLLSLAAVSCGGIVEAVEIATSPLRLEPVAATFHGRDIFAPVAAHIAAGTPLADAGEPCDPVTLVAIDLPKPRRLKRALAVHVLYIDHYGNVALDVDHEQLQGTGVKLGSRVRLQVAGRKVQIAHYARTFAEVEPGQLLVYEDAYRRLSIAISHGNAAKRLGLQIDHELRIRPE
jgi:S-adenosylmethionine hydrolase